MLVARDPLTNTFVNAFDYKHMSPEERPNGLLCPGVCFDGTPCTAPVTPAALSSEHKHPYFRVGRIDNHIDGCTEGATRVDPPRTQQLLPDSRGGRNTCYALSSSSRRCLGVSQFSVLRGRSLSSSAMASRSASVRGDRSVPLGMYWRNSPFVFSFVPRCQGECGSQKYTSRPNCEAILRC